MNKHIETLVQRYPQLESCKDDILKDSFMNNPIETLVQRYPQLDSCKEEIVKAYQVLEEA